jgi:hypothetical protein
MLRRIGLHLYRTCLVVALTVALAGTGFAHRLSVVEDQALSFVLATGASLADICDDAIPGSDHQGADCLACQIAGSADLPSLQGMRIDLDLAHHAAVIAPHAAQALVRVADPAHRPQGPPVA